MWKPLESPTRIKARLDGLEVMEPLIGMQPESPTRIKARLDGLDLPNKQPQFILPEIKIEPSPDQYKRAVKKERRGGGRFHTLPISFQEIKEVDEESVIEEPVSEESIGLRLRRPSIGVARSQSCRSSRPSPGQGLRVRRTSSFRAVEAAIEEVPKAEGELKDEVETNDEEVEK